VKKGNGLSELFSIDIERCLEKSIRGAIILAVVIVPLYFDRSLVGIYDISKATVLWLTAIFISGCWLYLLSLRKGFPPKTLLVLSIFAWITVNILATIFSESPIISIIGFNGQYNGLFTHLSYTILALSLITFGDKEFLKKLIKIIVIVGIISSIYGIMQYYGTDVFFPGRSEGGRIPSFMGNPIFFSCYLIMSLFLTLGLYFYANGLWIWIYGISFSIIYISFFMAQTRGTFLGFALSYLIFLVGFLYPFLSKRKEARIKAKRFWISLIIIGSITIFSNLSKNSLFERFKNEFFLSQTKIEETKINLKKEKEIKIGGSAKIRLCLWKDIGRNLLRKPLFGTGPDTMIISSHKYRSLETIRMTGAHHTAESSHNEFLDIVAQKGLLGGLAYLWILAVFLHLSTKTIFSEKEEGWWIAGIILSWLSYIFQSQFVFGVHSTESLFWVLTGGVGVFYKKPKPIKKEMPKRLSKKQKIVLSGISMTTIILFLLAITPYKADLAHQKAFNMQDKAPLVEVISAYEDAIKIWPYNAQYLQVLTTLYFTASQQEEDHKKLLLKTRDMATKLIRLNPNSDIAYIVIATTYYLEDRKNLPKVIENFKKASEVNPYSVNLHYNFGLMYQKEGLYKEAISEYEKCLLSDPSYEPALEAQKFLLDKQN
jgi:tetratricopeptide (TPR) repeat protein